MNAEFSPNGKGTFLKRPGVAFAKTETIQETRNQNSTYITVTGSGVLFHFVEEVGVGSDDTVVVATPQGGVERPPVPVVSHSATVVALTAQVDDGSKRDELRKSGIDVK